MAREIVYNYSITGKGGSAKMKGDYQSILKLETTPEALEATICYLAEKMKPFLQTLEPVLICFPDEGRASLGGLFKEAVLRCKAMPVFWGPDYRWKELLRIAFDTHANTVIGHPLVVLGLMKLARATATPLYVYDVIVCGDPFSRWMVDDLKRGLDCRVWGCYAVCSGPVIAGFSCEQEAGVHIRGDVFRPYLLAEQDAEPYANRGKICFVSAKNPDLVFDPEHAVLLHQHACSCGCDEPRVGEANPLKEDCLSREILDNKLLGWSSVLDYRAEKTESGMSLELVVFPGESLPRVPSAAKLTVRTWDPEDIPFCMEKYSFKIPEKIHEID